MQCHGGPLRGKWLSIYGALLTHSPHQACQGYHSLLTDEDAQAQTRVASCPKSTIRIRALLCMHSDASLLQDRLPLLGDIAQPGPSILPPASWAQKNDPGSNTLVHTEPGLPGGGSGRPRPWPGKRDSMQNPRGEQTPAGRHKPQACSSGGENQPSMAGQVGVPKGMSNLPQGHSAPASAHEPFPRPTREDRQCQKGPLRSGGLTPLFTGGKLRPGRGGGENGRSYSEVPSRGSPHAAP